MSTLSEINQLKEVLKATAAKTHPAKSILINEDDELAHLYYISRGFVRAYTITDDGDERVLLILKTGDIFPLLRDPDQSVHVSAYFYETMGEAQTITLNRQDFIDMIRTDRDASWAFLRYSSEIGSELANRVSSLESKSVEDKIRKLLLYLIGVCGIKKGPDLYLLDLKLTHLDIANLVGHTRESASVMMKNLQRQGVISYRSGYLLIHSDKV